MIIMIIMTIIIIINNNNNHNASWRKASGEAAWQVGGLRPSSQLPAPSIITRAGERGRRAH
jgi:hypothetical protein